MKNLVSIKKVEVLEKDSTGYVTKVMIDGVVYQREGKFVKGKRINVNSVKENGLMMVTSN